MSYPPLKIGDPVMDAAQGRPMVVLDVPDMDAAEWSEANDYDLGSNYGNSKFMRSDSEPVVEAVYVSDVRSEPSKSYTFPRGRLRLIDAHHADGGRRIADRVFVDVLSSIFIAAKQDDIEGLEIDDADPILRLVHRAVGPTELVGEAYELAQAETITADTEDDTE